MKNILVNLLGFIYTLNMGDYFFYLGTFLLIVLFIYIIYLVKCSEFEHDKKDEEVFDLLEVAKQIETEYKPEKITLTEYEEEQENSAIISYEELVKNKNKMGLAYEDEYIFDTEDLEVKKVNLALDNDEATQEPKIEVKLMQYDKEEAFLKALKELKNNLSL